MAHEAVDVHDSGSHGMAQFFWVWGGLLVLTAIEVALAYRNLPLVQMLFILLGLSFIKAALIIAYFMHLKYETPRMRWILMGSLCVCLALMMVFFPDSFRLLHLGVQGH
jgi:cytochrome c oxidase subunit IV